MPSLARSVRKPLKVPSLARSVQKPLKCLVLHVLFFRVLIWDLFDFSWDLVVLPICRRWFQPPPGSQARASLSPGGGANGMLPMGSHLSLFMFYIFPLETLFWPSIYRRFLLIFDPPNFLSPGGGSYWNAPARGPIWVSFSFISYPKWTFLISKTP